VHRGSGAPLHADGDPCGTELIARARKISGLAPDVDDLIRIVEQPLGSREVSVLDVPGSHADAFRQGAELGALRR